MCQGQSHADGCRVRRDIENPSSNDAEYVWAEDDGERPTDVFSRMQELCSKWKCVQKMPVHMERRHARNNNQTSDMSSYRSVRSRKAIELLKTPTK